MAKRTTKKTAKKSASKKTAKKTAKKASASKKVSKKVAGGGARGKGLGYKAGQAKGRHLVIVESPSKAKTINKYLGPDYVVLASVGHVRDLPSKAPKGDKSPVPGVKLEGTNGDRFKPSYQILDGKEAVIRDLKRAAKDASGSGGEIWFATDLDREGEAIAWHLAQELGIESNAAKRVIFPAITKSEIDRAFDHPHPIDEDRVNAQQARRILDRIVGYQVSPLLWKKVARGLSAGRVQSVAVRLVVERERQIRAFVPDEHWAVQANFAMDEGTARELGPAWRAFLAERDEKGNGPTVKKRNGWLGDRGAIRAELVEVAGEKFDLRQAAGSSAFETASDGDITPRVAEVLQLAGVRSSEVTVAEDRAGKGPARWLRSVEGEVDPATDYKVTSVETKRTTSRPPGPFITSTMQQAASSRLGFGAQRTMRAAQGLYEGVDVPGQGPTGLITYMRTDSTHLSPEAVEQARRYVGNKFGDAYVPDKANTYSSSNKAAQEAHEAIRPTNVALTPDVVAKALKPDQLRLYTIIWERFVACQMTPAKWDSTAALIKGGTDASRPVTFRATGRTLAFDGFYKVAGVPTSGDELVLPKLDEGRELRPFDVESQQKFTSPPARYTEASLIKTLESEGIGRPSTYASIIQVIQDRKYVEQLERRFYSTDLGEVVTDKLVEAFPEILDVGYTRDMESQLDKIEEEHLDWLEMLERFYGPFAERLDKAHEELTHAKAEVSPAPEEYRCQKCGSGLVYRFGKNGRFLSCETYPKCDYACPCDREGRPRPAEFVNVKCPKTGRPMVRKTGRFGPFLTTILEDGESNDVGMILNIDKKGFVTAPSVPPLLTDLPCPLCESPLNLRSGVRGPWLGCSRFPKCRGRGKWSELDDAARKKLEAELEKHEAANPVPIIETLSGEPLTDKKGKPLGDAPTVEALLLSDDPRKAAEPARVSA